MVAWLAGQEDLLAAFRDKRDVYSEFASEVYGRKITKADTVERFVGKTCILGLGYGMGAAKFQRTLEIGQAGVSVKIDLDEAHRIVRLYRERNHKIVALWNKCQRMLNNLLIGTDGTIGPLPYSVEGVVLPNGFTFRYPALRTAPGGDGYEYISDARMFRRALKARVMGGSTDDVVWTKVYGGKVTENLVQALAAIVIREQMVEIGRFYHVTFQVHDEIIITAPEDAGEAAERRLVEVMSTPPKWAPTLPVACEAGRATNYGDT
jgi:DNA polymerase